METENRNELINTSLKRKAEDAEDTGLQILNTAETQLKRGSSGPVRLSRRVNLFVKPLANSSRESNPDNLGSVKNMEESKKRKLSLQVENFIQSLGNQDQPLEARVPVPQSDNDDVHKYYSANYPLRLLIETERGKCSDPDCQNGHLDDWTTLLLPGNSVNDGHLYQFANKMVTMTFEIDNKRKLLDKGTLKLLEEYEKDPKAYQDEFLALGFEAPAKMLAPNVLTWMNSSEGRKVAYPLQVFSLFLGPVEFFKFLRPEQMHIEWMQENLGVALDLQIEDKENEKFAVDGFHMLTDAFTLAFIKTLDWQAYFNIVKGLKNPEVVQYASFDSIVCADVHFRGTPDFELASSTRQKVLQKVHEFLTINNKESKDTQPPSKDAMLMNELEETMSELALQRKMSKNAGDEFLFAGEKWRKKFGQKRVQGNDQGAVENLDAMVDNAPSTNKKKQIESTEISLESVPLKYEPDQALREEEKNEDAKLVNSVSSNSSVLPLDVERNREQVMTDQ